MKTKKNRRALLWGVLVAGFAGTLTVATHPVRAESVTSSAIAPGADGSGAPPATPYSWVEAARAAVLNGGLIAPPHYDWLLGTAGVASPALPERALD